MRRAASANGQVACPVDFAPAADNTTKHSADARGTYLADLCEQEYDASGARVYPAAP